MCPRRNSNSQHVFPPERRSGVVRKGIAQARARQFVVSRLYLPTHGPRLAWPSGGVPSLGLVLKAAVGYFSRLMAISTNTNRVGYSNISCSAVGQQKNAGRLRPFWWLYEVLILIARVVGFPSLKSTQTASISN